MHLLELFHFLLCNFKQCPFKYGIYSRHKVWRGRQSSRYFDMLIISESTYKFALTPVHIFPGVHKIVIMHESLTECIFKICTWIHWIFPPSQRTPHVPHPAQTVWRVSQSPTCRMPQVHNRKRDSNFWEVYLALFFWINLLNVFANIQMKVPLNALPCNF